MIDLGDGVLLGTSGTNEVRMLTRMATRHGYVAGAAGSGKTVTLQVLAEAFSDVGVPVFATDVTGELSGISQPGGGSAAVNRRLTELGLDATWTREGYPVMLWAAFGSHGHPVRTTVSELGPILLSRMLGLNDTQEAVLTVAFRVADEGGLLLLDTKDLRAMLKYVADNAGEISTTYGAVSAATIGTIQRALLQLEERGGDRFLGEPALEVFDFLQTDANGHGILNLLSADPLVLSRRAYSALMLWLLTELMDRLPEVDDLEKPKLVLLIDEAHLLLEDAPPPLIAAVEQILRTLTGRGVGVFLCTENPVDLPARVLRHLQNRVQHALRDSTPRDEQRTDAAAELLPDDSGDLTTAWAITELAAGEALVSVLAEDGTQSSVQRTLMVPPHTHLGGITGEQRRALLASSRIAGRYEAIVDRESAYEVLKARAEAEAAADAASAAAAAEARAALQQAKIETAQAKAKAAAEKAAHPSRGRRDSMLEAFGKSAIRSIGSRVGSTIIRGILGTILKTNWSGN